MRYIKSYPTVSALIIPLFIQVINQSVLILISAASTSSLTVLSQT